MPFHTEFLQNCAKEITVKTMDSDWEIVQPLLLKAIQNIADKNPNVYAKNVEIYIHGSYVNKTNIYFPSALEVAVELKRTATYSPDKITPDDYKLYNNYYVDMEMGFTPKQFRDMLIEELVELTGERCEERRKTILLKPFGRLRHEVDISPCFSFTHTTADLKDSFRGVMLYDAGVGMNILTFPKLHAQNGNAKDLATKGNFKRMVRVFKTLNALNIKEFSFSDETNATGYFIECMLFNVPNKLFLPTARKDDEHLTDIFNKVLNYLLNCDMEGFACQNMIWVLFGTAGEFWRLEHAQRFLVEMYNLHAVFPRSRTYLV
jgi:hypothetical protein